MSNISKEKLRVLVACEYSGTVRDAFIRLGHDAVSCDLLNTDSPGPHYQGDVFDIIDDEWDLMIAHPPCTYLTNAGVRHLHDSTASKNGKRTAVYGSSRWAAMHEGATFFKRLALANIPMIAIENPVPHKYAKNIIGPYTQIIHPWQFGHGETKATCLWLKGLPLLGPTNVVSGREGRMHKLPPSKDRWKLRSLTYQGIADAMANQWGKARIQGEERK